jgi:integrase
MTDAVQPLHAQSLISAVLPQRQLPLFRSSKVLQVLTLPGRQLALCLLHRLLHPRLIAGGQSVTELIQHGKNVDGGVLTFLHQRGTIKIDLVAALPGIDNWRLSDLPKSLPPEQVKKLLGSCDRSMPAGQRDHAILLLLARLGLRGGEVRALTLDNLDWERGEIVMNGKSQRLERLPLPREVGRTVANYLRYVRPVCSTRALFVRLQASIRGLGQSGIACLVSRALERAGWNPDFRGANLLRHYFSCRTTWWTFRRDLFSSRTRTAVAT